MTNTLLRITLATTALVGLQTMTPAQAGETVVAHKMTFMTRACPTEDSGDCYWDAGKSGNGEGHSFYAINIGKRVCIKYWNPKYGRKHNRCYPR